MWIGLFTVGVVALFYFTAEILNKVENLFSHVRNGFYVPYNMPDQQTVTFKRKDGSTVTFTKTGVRAAKRKAEKANKEVEKLQKKQKTETSV